MFKFISKTAAVLFSGIIVSVLASCGGNTITDPSEIVFPDTNVSYKSHVFPLLSLSCAYIGCHSDESAAGNLRLTSHIAMFQHAGLIVRFKPDNSVLIQTIEGTLPHKATYRQDFNANQKKGMRQWVLEGAKDN